ncbi:MAG: radical SAM protein [Calditrichaeota bacterium]|nr:radical SAM protein [Calditrichota bacterium]
MHKSEPLIFDIAKGSFVDGPGIRTTIFFKGCPLDCPWCHNPESKSYESETMFYPENCIECGNCKVGRKCFALARRTVGKHFSPEHLGEVILQDKSYYETSGGGVTFSGGEPLSFIDYLSQVALILKEQDIHIAIQTSGHFNYRDFALKVLPYTDTIYYDFKIMDNATHKLHLGISNSIIIANFIQLQKQDITLIPRIPLIPHYVANQNNLSSIATFFAEQNVQNCEFIYYNPSAQGKVSRLDRGMVECVSVGSVSVEGNRRWVDYFKGRVRFSKSNLAEPKNDNSCACVHTRSAE